MQKKGESACCSRARTHTVHTCVFYTCMSSRACDKKRKKIKYYLPVFAISKVKQMLINDKTNTLI